MESAVSTSTSTPNPSTSTSAPSYGNPLQNAAVIALIAAFATVRSLKVTARVIAANLVTTVSGYVIAATSLVIEIVGENGETLPDFPAIECKRTGKFALPTIRSYKEANVPNSLLPYPNGNTAFDAALFADSHTRKQNGGWLRRSPQAATAAIVGAVNNAPVAPAAPVVAPAGVSAETGQDTAKLTSEIQGKPDKHNRK